MWFDEINKKNPRYFTDREMEKVLEASKSEPELYTRTYVHWKTGLRLRELDKSYLENGFIRTYDPCKNETERVIPVDKETAYFYNLAKAGKYTAGTISKMFMRLLIKLGLYETKAGDKRHFHNLRDSFAVRTYYLTRDNYRVKALLGHSSVKTTEIYANFDLSLLEADFGTTETPREPLKRKINKPLPEKNRPVKESINPISVYIDPLYNPNYVN